MTRLVPADRVERIVGARRHPLAHLGRAVSAEQVVYILHSEECLATTSDLRYCTYSQALDQGVDFEGWTEDTTVTLMTVHGVLMADPDGPADVKLLATGEPR